HPDWSYQFRHPVDSQPGALSRNKCSFSGHSSAVGSTSTLSQWLKLKGGNAGLSEGEQRQEHSHKQTGNVNVFLVAKKDYDFLDFSKQLLDAGSELTKLNWKWFLLGAAGFICLLCGVYVT